MRFGLVFCWCATVLVAAGSMAAEPPAPYEAYVVADDVYIRSGPGKNYYPTAKLKKGDMLEVYRHDPGGWLAVRPPQDSFSWISGRYLELGDDSLATITGDQVAARVGSRFSDVRDVIQVRLHRGEVVQILGEKRFAASTDRGIWYKIAPSSGEFRWIHGKYIDQDYLTSGVREASDGQSPLLSRSRAAQASSAEPQLLPGLKPGIDSDAQKPGRLDSAAAQPRQQWLDAADNTTASVEEESQSPAVQPAAATVDDADRGVEMVNEVMDDESQVVPAAAERPETIAYISPRIPELRQREREPAAASASTSGTIRPEKPFGQELNDLDFELSVMLSEEPTVWSLEELQIRTESLLGRAETALDRGRVRLLRNRIAQSADIKQRYDRVHDTRQDTERENRQLASLSRNRAGEAESPATQSAPAADNRFDGSGRLARVAAPKLGSPRFALVDEEGDVDCYVSPAPGVNLRYYVGRRVGVTGIRGFIPEQKAQHVTAKHITPLDARWLR